MGNEPNEGEGRRSAQRTAELSAVKVVGGPAPIRYAR